MKKDNIVQLKKPGLPIPVNDVLTEVLRQGARAMLAAVVKTEAALFIEGYREDKLLDGRARMVLNGHRPERPIQTGVGSIEISMPRVRDRNGEINFTSSILPPYLRRTKTIEELLPWLYLKGISTGDFNEALSVLLGPNAAGLSAGTISRLKEVWQEEHHRWSRRDLSNKVYAYIWVDGIYFGVRSDDAAQCILVVMGATADGDKELISVCDGLRESEQSWHEVLLDLKARGLKIDPKLAIGDGSLGFWKALPKVFGTTKVQRCWVHKTANVLNKLPKNLQPKAKALLQEIWMAATKEDALKAFRHFIAIYEPKYPKATECLEKDGEALMAFFDFPAQHWAHIRTTNPIESTFATVRLRTAKTRGCVSRETILAMVFKLTMSAEQRWHRLRGSEFLPEVIAGIIFKDGVKEIDKNNEDKNENLNQENQVYAA